MIFSQELEKKVLSGVVQHQHVWPEIAEVLTPTDFYSKDSTVHRSLFLLCKHALDNTEAVDEVVLIERFKQLKATFPDSIDLEDYIRNLFFFAVSEDAFMSAIRELKKYTARREVQESCYKVEKFVKNIEPTASYIDIINGVDKIYSGTLQKFESGGKSFVNLFEQIPDIIEERGNNPIDEFGFMGPHPKINSIFGSLLRAGNISVVCSRTGVGKALSNKCRILTTKGWKENGQLTLEDKVLSPSGKPVSIKGIFDHPQKEMYEIRTVDGRSIKCDGDHLWKVWSRTGGPYHWMIVDTVELARRVNLKTTRSYLPLVDGIDLNFTGNELPIDPYLLGVILGDGCMSANNANASICLPDDFIYDKVSKITSCGRKNMNKNLTCFSFRLIGKDQIKQCLKNLGLWGKLCYDKFIPEEYFESSFSNRMALLQGLMNTDGTLSRCGGSSSYGSLEYSTTSEQLAKDVQRLVFSIGGICKVSSRYTFYTHNGEKKRGRKSYRIRIRYKNPKDVFSLPRKRDLLGDTYQYPNLKLKITSVEKTGEIEDCRCISLEGDEKLYVTEDFLVTHNTSFALDFTTKIASQYNIPVLHFDNGEMSEEELSFRQVSAMTQLPMWLFETGKWRHSSYGDLSPQQVVKKVRSIWPKIQSMKFYYENVAGMTPEEMVGLLKRFYYSEVGRGKPLVFSFDYIKSDFSNRNQSDGWAKIAYMVHKFKQAIHRELCFDGKPCVSMFTAVQANRSGITTNRNAAEIVDDEGVVGLSDAISQFCSHLFLLRKKVIEEVANEGQQFGTHKLIPLKFRHLGRDIEGALHPVELPDGSKKQNFINLEFSNFGVTEKGDLRDIVKNMDNETITVEENESEGLPESLQ